MDLALFIARSFGRWPPVVIVLTLIAVGSWYLIKELSTLQSRLIEAKQKQADAEIEQAKAEAGAAFAVVRARAEIMAEQIKPGRVHTNLRLSTIRAKLMKVINTTSSFSNREKMRLKPLILLNNLSTSFRLRYIARSYSQGSRRLLLGGTTGI
ncbi:MAG: hypothetical protein AUK36_04535 [Zetaproteobacteria bacterium CG2_30_59_37]|nr:MAG: hypothetical protein AUK36_04535 [Zetaproteobacteria bacterium CG2_30_59_37]